MYPVATRSTELLTSADAAKFRRRSVDPDGNIIDDVSVDCSPLATGDTAYRTVELSAPQQATIGYSIELWVDIDHHGQFSEGYNYAYDNVHASEDW